jgi:hypothetical protein
MRTQATNVKLSRRLQLNCHLLSFSGSCLHLVAFVPAIDEDRTISLIGYAYISVLKQSLTSILSWWYYITVVI